MWLTRSGHQPVTGIVIITLTMQNLIHEGRELIVKSGREELRCSLVKNKHVKLAQFLMLTTIPTIIVIIQNALNLQDDLRFYRANSRVQQDLSYSLQVGKIMHEIQIERGTTALYVSSNRDLFVKARLTAQYKHTELSIQSLTSWRSLDKPDYFQSRGQFNDHIWKFRNSLAESNMTLVEVIEFYTDINAIIEGVMTKSMRFELPFSYWNDLEAFGMLTFSKEQAGIERAIGSSYYVTGSFALKHLLWFHEKMVLGTEFLAKCLQQSEFARDHLGNVFSGTKLSDSINAMRSNISSNTEIPPSVLLGTIWFDNMTSYIDILKVLQDRLANRIITRAASENSILRNTLIASSVQLAFAVVMLPVIICLVTNVVNFSIKLHEKTKDLEEEKKQSESLCKELKKEKSKTTDLLYQLLPKSVAQNLMEKGWCLPESFESASVMFSDVVGFTKIASMSTPLQVVDMLNALYKTMDTRIENYDVYKVETIGDAYMVASGIPTRNDDRHVLEIASLALDLLDTLDKMLIPHMQHEKIKLRIGFNTGPCVAGVVGVKMPRYCVFGDTVNTASRMESTGLPLRIQMTESSAKLLKDVDTFAISERGNVEVKGKGKMRTFWLERNHRCH